jgi:hypothetical protein
MADLDNAYKRSSGYGFQSPFNRTLPWQTGTVDSARYQVLKCYLGLAAVAGDLHTHDVDIAVFDSETVSNVSPYIVVYMWKRIA